MFLFYSYAWVPERTVQEHLCFYICTSKKYSHRNVPVIKLNYTMLSIAIRWQFWEIIQFRKTIILGIRLINSRISERVDLPRDQLGYIQYFLWISSNNMLSPRAKHIRWKMRCRSYKVRLTYFCLKLLLR